MSVYLNVYEMDRVYGGPEEGGWYFTTYEPLVSVVFPDTYAELVRWGEDQDPITWNPTPEHEFEVQQKLDKLEKLFPHTGRAGWTSYRGGDCTIRWDLEAPVNEPSEYPHYE